MHHMASATTPMSEKESLTSCRIAFSLSVISRSVQQVHPVRQPAKLLLGKRERGHSAGHPIPNDAVNLGFAPAAERAVVDECGRPVAAHSSIPMASRANLCKLCLGGMRVGRTRIQLRCGKKPCGTDEYGQDAKLLNGFYFAH